MKRVFPLRIAVTPVDLVQQRACDRNVFMNATHFRIALKEPRKVEPKFH